MKLIITKYLITGIILVATASCTKLHHPPGTASLNIVNAVVGSKPLLPIFTSERPVSFFKNASRISYKEFNLGSQFTAYSGVQELVVYQYPDTLKGNQPLFNLNIDLPIGSIRTLFLTGTVNTPDTIFTFDQPPYSLPADSSTGIRFVNLSQGSAPISVNIAGKTNGSEVGQLPYKGVTKYNAYKINNTVFDDYVFEFRDSESGALIASYALNSGDFPIPQSWLYRSFTLALAGLPGGTGLEAQSVFVVPHQTF